MSAQLASVCLPDAPHWAWRAVCFSCRWEGPLTTVQGEAIDDVVRHNEGHRMGVAV